MTASVSGGAAPTQARDRSVGFRAPTPLAQGDLPSSVPAELPVLGVVEARARALRGGSCDWPRRLSQGVGDMVHWVRRQQSLVVALV